MTVVQTGRAELVVSIAHLAEQVAKLARSFERARAAAKLDLQKEPTQASRSKPPRGKSKSRKIEGPADIKTGATNGLQEAVTLSPADEPEVQAKEKTGGESLVAAGISDLYDRLGGFLTDSLQPPHERTQLK